MSVQMDWWVYLLLYWIVSAMALGLTAFLTPGFRVRGFGTAMIATFLIAAANYYIRPVLIFLTFPITVLTLGFFIFVVDAIILRLCAAMLSDFEISGWISAVVGAILLSVTSGLLHWLLI
jgi:putative membrane protein